jgi:hypothetical protein
MISRYRDFGCPTIDHHWVTFNNTNEKQTERGIRGIFIGFVLNQKGYIIFSPGSRQIIISDDIIFDEGFSSAIAATWQQHKDSLALQPISSHIPDITTTIEHTSTIEDLHSTPVKEGDTNNDDEDDDDTLSLCPNLDEDFDEYDSDDEAHLTTPPATVDEAETPMVLDLSGTLRHSNRTYKPNPKYANLATIIKWMNTWSDLDLLEACAAEAHQHLIPSLEDAHS